MRALQMVSGIRKTSLFRTASVAASWVLGLLSGAYILFGSPFISVMRSVTFSGMSIVGLMVSYALPMLLSYILLRFSHFNSILPIVFLKAFMFICVCGSIEIIFGDAGWLICGFILFSDFFHIVLLLFYWFNAAKGKKFGARFMIIFYIILPIMVGCIDYFVVSPYSVMLLNY